MNAQSRGLSRGLRILSGVVLAAAVGAGGYWLAANWSSLRPASAGAGTAAAGAAGTAGTAGTTSRPAPSAGAEADEIAFWTCVMHPTVRRDGPGKCPVCQMDLVPVKKGAGLALTRRQKELVPVRTEPLGFHALFREIRTVGTLTYNERKLAVASTRVSGWIERLFVDFTGTRVRVWYACPDHPEVRSRAPGTCPRDGKRLRRRADHLVEIYSPELLTAQEEYLQAIRAAGRLEDSDLEIIRTTARATVAAAEAKLRLLGLTGEQISAIRRRGRAVETLTLFAPIGGTVIEVKARLGQHVKAGQTLFRIADLSTLWMLADIYEYELPWLRPSMEVEITGDAFPGETFRGRIAFVYPFLQAKTRTVKALVEVPNRDRRLKPGMAVAARLRVSLAEIYRRDRGSPPAYACPMHPWITAEVPGQCPICGMTLERVAPPGTGEGAPASRPALRRVLACSMPGHPVFEPDQAPADGKCPVCGMKLEERMVPRRPPEGEAPGPLAGLHFEYACPDHPEVRAEGPGSCPKDGKPLVMTGRVLAVPRSAVIDTGERAVVYVDLGEAGYAAREVKVGPEGWTYDEAGNRLQRYLPVISGLAAGEKVVVRGNFLIDSQTQITGTAGQAYGGEIGGVEKTPAPGK